MHLNELFRAHRTEVMKASAAEGNEERGRHLSKVAFYAERIRIIHFAERAARLLSQISPTQVHSNAGGMDVSFPSTKDHPSWENEGGAIAPPTTQLPSTAPLRMPAQYFVGDEVYSDLTLAVEAHASQKLG